MSFGTSDSDIKIWPLIPAAGIGARMKESKPKQYLELQGKPILIHTLERLLQLNGVQSPLLIINKEDNYLNDLKRKYSLEIKTTIGGGTRAESVLNGLEYMVGVAQKNDWILVHDAARPCVLTKDIESLIHCCISSNAGGILAKPIDETIKMIESKGENSNQISGSVKGQLEQPIEPLVKNTVDRSRYWLASTPQMFQFEILLESLTKSLKKNITITDEASAVEACHHPVQLVECSKDNIKVTTKEDLNLVSHILQKQACYGV